MNDGEIREFLKAAEHDDLRLALQFVKGYAPKVFGEAVVLIESLQRTRRDVTREATGGAA